MIILPTQDRAPRRWDSSDAKNLRDFLATETGILYLEWLAFRCPKFLDGTNADKTLVASGRVEGYISSLKETIDLTVEQPAEVEAAPEPYPSLDDESKWDGPKPK